VPQIQADLNELATLDITPLDTPEPELAYLFKHIVTHEVAYESLSYARRASLHEQLAHYLERIDASVVTLAQHYGLSETPPSSVNTFIKLPGQPGKVSPIRRRLNITPGCYRSWKPRGSSLRCFTNAANSIF
jgi:hypothetical protein